MTPSLLILALIVYIVGVFLTTIATVYRSELARRAASIVFVTAWLAHLGALIERAIATDHVPLTTVRIRSTASGYVLPMQEWPLMPTTFSPATTWSEREKQTPQKHPQKQQQHQDRREAQRDFRQHPCQ